MIACVFRGYLTFGLHHQFATRHKQVYNIYGFVQQSAAVASEVEYHSAYIGVVGLKFVESRSYVFGGILGKLVQLYISVIFTHKAIVWHWLELNFLTFDGALERLSATFELQMHVGSGLSAKYAAHVGGGLTLSRLAVYFQYLVAGS